jgi:hypothetical protein
LETVNLQPAHVFQSRNNGPGPGADSTQNLQKKECPINPHATAGSAPNIRHSL